LQEYLLLECAKITDPATTRKFENFTAAYVVQKITWPNDKQLTSMPDGDTDVLQKLESLRNTTQDFRGDIDCARNKLLAHLDKGAVLSGEPLGAFPEGKDKTFFEALQRICIIAHEACFGKSRGEMSTVMCGDVIGLRKTLEFAVAFKVALSESSPENRRWLYSCLEEA